MKARKPKGYDEHPTTLAGHLLMRRKELGLWQREVAERVGVSSETYLSWEKHAKSPEIWHWPKIINFLGYDPYPNPARDRVSDEIEWARRRLVGRVVESDIIF
jgi:DNA-binding XRE family transcriptional regulator